MMTSSSDLWHVAACGTCDEAFEKRLKGHERPVWDLWGPVGPLGAWWSVSTESRESAKISQVSRQQTDARITGSPITVYAGRHGQQRKIQSIMRSGLDEQLMVHS